MATSSFNTSAALSLHASIQSHAGCCGAGDETKSLLILQNQKRKTASWHAHAPRTVGVLLMFAWQVKNVTVWLPYCGSKLLQQQVRRQPELVSALAVC